ncbi:methyltransferase domain-containing protein [Deinococcus yunweiensis]|uniref:methyltransferase domain-containing protein n=1 Tax=Deinococcus yunweiensis TaxID=367282 RepID=UPI00398E4044
MTTPDSWEERNRRQFDALAAAYDRMGFLTQVAQVVAAQVPVAPGQAVLDVMTGTGHVALALAPHVQPGGRVVGTDLSGGMLAVARARAAGLEHVSFVQADATALPLTDEVFDVVACASGVFFVPDMVAAVREWRRVVRPGGVVVLSSFGVGLLGDLPGRWRERLGTHGVTPGFPPTGRLPTQEAARDLLISVGLEDVEVTLTDVSYVLADVNQRWADIVAGLEGQPLAGLTPDARAQVEADHRADLAALFASGPVTVPLPVIVARGMRGS